MIAFDLGSERGHESLRIGFMALGTGCFFRPGVDGLEQFKFMVAGIALIFIDRHGSNTPLLRIHVRVAMLGLLYRIENALDHDPMKLF